LQPINVPYQNTLYAAANQYINHEVELEEPNPLAKSVRSKVSKNVRWWLLWKASQEKVYGLKAKQCINIFESEQYDT
jgi:hypothetical protein